MEVKERIKLFIEFKGITIKKFEEQCGLSNGYIAAMRKSFGDDKLSNVLKVFPELNREWLLYGEDDMLRGAVKQVGNGNNNQQGENISYTSSAPSDFLTLHAKALDEITAQRKLVEVAQEHITKSQEQIDRLLSLLEKK